MQLSGTVLRAVEQILREAERKPADAALRSLLRTGGAFHQEQKALISRAVFAYYRWRGWLNPKLPLRGQLEHVFDLAQSVEQVSDRDLLERTLPGWMAGAMELSPALLREFQREPRLWLRARPGTAAQLAQRLHDVEVHPTIPDALWYQGSDDLFRTPEFHGGQFEIQDLSSQMVGHQCAPVPGQTWWDCCAGEGGKTLHLCDLLQNKGLVWASDTTQWRLDVLKRRASRAKLFNYRLKLWSSKDHLPTKTKFDGILVDAPCSGLGTWGRNPHARWTATAEDVLELAALQTSILDKVAGSVKPGGELIYSVCTLTNAETSGVAGQFEAGHPEFTPKVRKTLRPEEWHATGMFIAGWRRAK